MEQKKIMRSNVRKLKKQYTAQQLQEMSNEVITCLLDNSYIKKASTIMLYYSLPDEVFTHEVINTLAAEGKKILLPVVIDNENMELREYHDDNDLTLGAYDIMEPTGKLFTAYDTIDVAVVPGMMFDRECNRLGRGKGYYDRFLKKIRDVHKIGICFKFQIAESVPSNINDVRVDELIY